MVRSYDKTPGMKSKNLTNKVIKESSNYDFIFLNLAAPDMIGHTGNLKAGIECCEIIDKCLIKIVEHYLKINGTVIVSADHGNVEKLFDIESGKIDTKHTKNPVPLIIINEKLGNLKLRKNGKLSNIAPTVLNLLNIKKPELMREDSLIKKYE
jgi:2,3-bisphosphoglycerate-independent phosphoglycerate mutase